MEQSAVGERDSQDMDRSETEKEERERERETHTLTQTHTHERRQIASSLMRWSPPLPEDLRRPRPHHSQSKRVCALCSMELSRGAVVRAPDLPGQV